MQSTILPKKANKFKHFFKTWFWKSSSVFLFTFSLEEPTAKQLSKDSRELTTNLKIRKKINGASWADLTLNQLNKQKKNRQLSTCCSLCWSKCKNNTECKHKCCQEKNVDVQVWKWCMACSQSQAWTHKLAHVHKTIQTSRERAVTNRSKVDKDSVSQLFIVFLGAKEKEQKQSVRITERNKWN